MSATVDKENPWKDPAHPGNKIRPRVVCIGCGKKGCITAWGPWCFECNVKRMTRLNGRFDEMRSALKSPAPIPAQETDR